MLEYRINFFVSNAFRVPTIAECMTLTDDLEVQDHIIMNMTFVISDTTHARAIEIGKVLCKIT